MYGYIRPLKCELKVKEYEVYSAAYCGLCHLLRRRYGPLSRLLVSYDMTFVALLLSNGEFTSSRALKRCPVSPFVARIAACGSSHGAELAADAAVILMYHKLADDAADSGMWGRLRAAIGRLILRPAYTKATRARPETAHAAESAMRRLEALEAEGCRSLDIPADVFASLISSCAPEGDDNRRRVLYHCARFVYIIDAVDDLRADMNAGRYNAVAARWALAAPLLCPDDMEQLRLTLECSLAEAAAAAEGLEKTRDWPVISNILYLGLPSVMEEVTNKL